jgi:hypothetical protein
VDDSAIFFELTTHQFYICGRSTAGDENVFTGSVRYTLTRGAAGDSLNTVLPWRESFPPWDRKRWTCALLRRAFFCGFVRMFSPIEVETATVKFRVVSFLLL